MDIRWDTLSPQNRIRYLKVWIDKIVVGKSEIQMVIHRSGLRSSLGYGMDVPSSLEAASSNVTNTFAVVISVKLRHSGVELKSILSSGSRPKADQATIKILQNALVRALVWNQAMLSGEIKSLAEIAKSEKVTQRYIARIHRLAFLAPEQMKAIISGDVASGMHLNKLCSNISMSWIKQAQI